MALGAYAHQELPFEQVVEALQPATESESLASVPGDVGVAEHAGGGAAVGGAEVEPAGRWPAGRRKFDLTLALGESGEGLLGSLEYTTDLFEA